MLCNLTYFIVNINKNGQRRVFRMKAVMRWTLNTSLFDWWIVDCTILHLVYNYNLENPTLAPDKIFVVITG